LLWSIACYRVIGQTIFDETVRRYQPLTGEASARLRQGFGKASARKKNPSAGYCKPELISNQAALTGGTNPHQVGALFISRPIWSPHRQN
jgi:hypothetical protein